MSQERAGGSVRPAHLVKQRAVLVPEESVYRCPAPQALERARDCPVARWAAEIRQS